MKINERVSPKRLAEIIARAEVCDDSVLTDYRDIESIARELQQYRAAAEPVAWVMKDDLADTDIISTPAYLSFSDAVTKTVGKLIPLYTAPQVTSVHPAKNLELAGWQFKSVNGDWLGLIGEHGKNQAVREGCVVREVFAMADGINDREQVRREHAAWSESTFGNVGPIGPLKHLSKEALEAASEPDDLSEWADMQFLLWDAQRRAGITDEQITQAMVEKLAVNKQREWPEPKDGEPRLHIAAPAVQAEQLSGNTEHVSQPVLPEHSPCVDAPDHIWLQTAGEWPASGEFSELTWSCDNQHPDDTLYVRADLVGNSSGYLQGYKDGCEWSALMAEANHPQTGDWLFDDPIELAKAIRKGPDMLPVEPGNSPAIPDGWQLVPKEATPEMLNASWVSHGVYHPSAYRTMLAAAPAAPKQEAE